jgi:carboxylesterase type B
LGLQIAEIYSKEIGSDPQLAYDTIGSDIEVTCGNLAVAMQAASSFASPVYASVTSYAPAKPAHTYSNKNAAHYAFHSWDVATAFGLYKRGTAMWGKKKVKRSKQYKPQPADLAFGKMMREIWSNFADTGVPPESMGWKPILPSKHQRRLGEVGNPHKHKKHKSTIWAKQFNVANLADAGCLNSTGSCIKQDFKAKACKFWQHAGFGPKFWWAN